MSTSPRAKAVKPQHHVYSNFDEVQQDVQGLYDGMQQKNFRVTNAAPNVSQISEGEFVLMDDGANRRIYTKINGALRYVTLT